MTDLGLLRTTYEKRKLTAERFAIRLGEQIREMLGKEEISLAVPLESRIKSWDSIQTKLERRKIDLSDIAQLNDFVGLRVILLFTRDVSRVRELLTTKLSVLSSEDTLERLGTEQFGYQSIHLQLKLPEDWQRVPTFADFNDLSAEVQVRTAAQHIWAAASHTLQYKQELGVPTPVLRSINRVAALLETVDLEFERVLQQRQAYASVIESSDEDSPLNVDLLRRILDSRLPAQNYAGEEDYDELLIELLGKGVRSSRQLEDLITAKLKDALRDDHEMVKAFREQGRPRSEGKIEVAYKGRQLVATPDRISLGVFKSHTGLIRNMFRI